MSVPNIFEPSVTKAIIERIHQLKHNTQPKWGTMSADKMLAHCNVTYEMIYEDKHPKPGFVTGIILKAFVKKIVTNEKPYKQNSQTAPAFIIKDSRVFEAEKSRLIDHLTKTQALGEAGFNGKESHSFGKLNAKEWSNMFYKHLDHHLSQFGV